MCGCECFISEKSAHSSLLTRCGLHLQQLKDQSHNSQNIRSGEIVSRIFETYKNSLRLHCYHIHNTAIDVAMATIYTCLYINHGILQWKCVLCCCNKFPIIVIPIQEANKYTTFMFPTISFLVYKKLSCCTMHDIRPYEELTIFLMCSTMYITDINTTVCTQKGLVLLDTYIIEFY